MSAKITAFEGTVEQGLIRLDPETRLPDKTKVYILVPEGTRSSQGQILSPRLAHPEQASDFEKQVVEALPDAEI